MTGIAGLADRCFRQLPAVGRSRARRRAGGWV